jgi:hypothetical protein
MVPPTRPGSPETPPVLLIGSVNLPSVSRFTVYHVTAAVKVAVHGHPPLGAPPRSLCRG